METGIEIVGSDWVNINMAKVIMTCGKIRKIALEKIREQERESHEKLYMCNNLYEPGSWLEHPVKTVMENLEYFSNNTSAEILDLGCGVGRNSIAMAQYYKEKGIACNIDCVDLLEVAINKLNENMRKYEVSNFITPILSTIDAFDMKSRKYDYIVSVSGIEHVADEKIFRKVLRNIEKSVKSKGIVCLIINTDLREIDVKSGQEQEALFEVNMPTNEMMKLLTDTFEEWYIIKKTTVHQEWITSRNGKDIKLDTNVITFVARKES